jgi:hypothetical protein
MVNATMNALSNLTGRCSLANASSSWAGSSSCTATTPPAAATPPLFSSSPPTSSSSSSPLFSPLPQIISTNLSSKLFTLPSNFSGSSSHTTNNLTSSTNAAK